LKEPSRRAREAQLGLFDRETVQGRLPDPDPATVALAARVPQHVRFGTSSWTFPGWKGVVYRRPYANDTAFVRESLYEYARHPLFRTVGVDRSFYEPLPEATWRDYAEQAPPGFVFVPKVFRDLLTPHLTDASGARVANHAFLDPARFDEVVGRALVSGLGATLGPVLLTLAPSAGSVGRDEVERKLERFLGATSGFRFAVELRDPSLLTARYLSILSAHGASHVFSYWERMPAISAQLEKARSLGPVVVCRLLIPPGRKYDDQKEAFAPFDRIVEADHVMRRDVAALIDAAGASGSEVFVLVNNKAEGSSPLTVRAIAEMIAR
jgi:uncharacterized protein YecE (DUF72 family)